MIVSVLLTIAKGGWKQHVITSPDYDVLSVRACRSRLWLSVGLHWSELTEFNSDFRFWWAFGRGTRCSSLDNGSHSVSRWTVMPYPASMACSGWPGLDYYLA